MILAIVGPTASGKTTLALELAKKYDGEIICADSRTIYRGMDIGTAKPTAEDRRLAPHYLIDILDPDQTYSAQQFKVEAQQIISDIRRRGKLPVVTGGTGLYAYSLIYDYQFPGGQRTAERVRLESLSMAELVAQLQVMDPERASEIDLQNPRRVIRALETVGQPRTKTPKLPSSTLLLGLNPDDEALDKAIVQRTKSMIEQGLVEEVTRLLARYNDDLEVFRSPGYTEIIDYLRGRSSLEQAIDLINLHSRQLVRRQRTWFRRNTDICWLSELDQASAIVRDFVTNKV